jgi:dienelactone hydrolase
MSFTRSAAISILLTAPLPLRAGADPGTKPTIQVDPERALVDEVVHIRAAGLEPGASATLKAVMRDTRGREWRSEATYVADEDGRVDPTRQAPVSGTYEGVDAMGLFWSMQLPAELPDEEVRPAVFTFEVDKPATAQLQLQVHGQPVARATLTRLFMKPGVRVQEVRDDGMVGALYLPPGAGPHPALLVLSGSNGGMERGEAALLASHGYAAFALAYFREEGLPADLVEIPLEYLKKGLDWMARHDAIDAERIGAFGGSKGGELSLLLGSMFPQIRSVVAYVPSHVVWQGISMSGRPPDAPSWTYEAKGLDFVHCRPNASFYLQLASGKPLRLLDLYQTGLADAEEVARAIIAVEKINGPVLLVSGGNDKLWPSAAMAEKVIERLKANSHPYEFAHLRYDEAGHGIGMSYLPALAGGSRSRLAFGGTEAATAHAQADSWPKVLAFFKRHLGSRRRPSTDPHGEDRAPRR